MTLSYFRNERKGGKPGFLAASYLCEKPLEGFIQLAEHILIATLEEISVTERYRAAREVGPKEDRPRANKKQSCRNRADSPRSVKFVDFGSFDPVAVLLAGGD